MSIIQNKKPEHSKKTMGAAVARVAGAVQVAGAAVSATMAIKDEALDDINAMKSKSNEKSKKHAVKIITSDTKKYNNLKKV